MSSSSSSTSSSSSSSSFLSPLFASPLTLPCGLVLKNRIIRAAAFAGGDIAEQAATHGEVARGGAALTTIAYTSVSGDGRTFAQQILLTKAGAPSNLHDIARAVHAGGGLISYQLTHAGGFADKKLIDRSPASSLGFYSSSSAGETTTEATAATTTTAATSKTIPLAPAAVFDIATFDYPHECTSYDMDRLEFDFATAASLAVNEGEADAVEVHLGHGYLLSQWLCPLTNTRKDEHGGRSVENRLRFPLRILFAVRKAIGPKKAMFVKINITDGFAGGVSPEDVDYFVTTLCKQTFTPISVPTHQDVTNTSLVFLPEQQQQQLLIDGIIPSAGFVSKNGFFMLRGSVPRLRMVKALSKVSRAKAAALALLGFWLVPELPFTEGFLLKEGARRVLKCTQTASVTVTATATNATSTTVPVLAIGGFVDIPGVEAALQEGFQGIQMARALIREPDLVNKWLLASSTSITATTTATSTSASTLSKCSHCNVCVLAALDPEIPSRCIERPHPSKENLFLLSSSTQKTTTTALVVDMEDVVVSDRK